MALKPCRKFGGDVASDARRSPYPLYPLPFLKKRLTANPGAKKSGAAGRFSARFGRIEDLRQPVLLRG